MNRWSNNLEQDNGSVTEDVKVQNNNEVTFSTATNMEVVNPQKSSELRDKIIIFGTVAVILGIVFLYKQKKV